MAKKSKKQRAKKQKSRGARRPARPTAAEVALETCHTSGMRLRAESAPQATVGIEDEVEVEVVATSQRDVEEALAAVAEEQRASQRVAVAVDIHLASDSQFFSGLSGDISEGGLFLSTYRALPVGCPVDIELTLPGTDTRLHAHGEVRWVREHSTGQPRGVGIAFDHLAEDDRERIHRFCTMRPPLYYDDVG
jgi:uncharacterized protein (TIGR02266 family)